MNSLTCRILKTQQINKTKLPDTENRLVVIRGQGGWTKWVKGVDCMEIEWWLDLLWWLLLLHTNFEICCTLGTNIMLYTNFTSIKKLQERGWHLKSMFINEARGSQFYFFTLLLPFVAIKALNFAKAKYEVDKESNDFGLRVNKILEWKKITMAVKSIN